MLLFEMDWECMDCECRFKGHVETDSEVILCNKCCKDFEDFVNEDSCRSFTLYWWSEFVKINGYRKDRKDKHKFLILDELLA